MISIFLPAGITVFVVVFCLLVYTFNFLFSFFSLMLKQQQQQFKAGLAVINISNIVKA